MQKEHDWEMVDSEGKEMMCSQCGTYASYYYWDWNNKLNSNCEQIRMERENISIKKVFGVFQLGYLEAVFFDEKSLKEELKSDINNPHLDIKEIFIFVNQFHFQPFSSLASYYETKKEAEEDWKKIRIRNLF